MIALLTHAAGCFVRYHPIASINPAEASIEDESRVQCLGYGSWRYVIVGVIRPFHRLRYLAFRATYLRCRHNRAPRT